MFKYVIMALEGNAMEYMNATNARKNFFNLISDVNRDHVPVRISGPRGSAVLIGEEDWNSIQETLRLYSIPGLAESIHEASVAPAFPPRRRLSPNCWKTTPFRRRRPMRSSPGTSKGCISGESTSNIGWYTRSTRRPEPCACCACGRITATTDRLALKTSNAHPHHGWAHLYRYPSSIFSSCAASLA